jgi:PAS domain S-box-containing protein
MLWSSKHRESKGGSAAAHSQSTAGTDPGDIERRLRASEERFKIMFEYAPDAYYLCDMAGTFLDGNRKAEELIGASRSEMIGQSFLALKLIDKADIGRAAGLLARNLLGKPTGPDEFVMHKKDGATVTAEICTYPVEIDKKRMVLGIARDVTGRKRVQAELEKAQDIAETASRAKELFLANMSHEIRTPLAAMIGFARMLGETPLTTQQRDYVEAIRSSGDMLLGLIGNVLDFSRMEAGGFKLEFVNFDLEQVLSGLLPIARFALAGKNVDVRLNYPGSTHRLFRGDPTRIRQIFLNLLNNAAKFTTAGSITITAFCENIRGTASVGKTQKLVHVCVADTGVGIPLCKQREIFEPFVQAEDSTARHHGGTGLGLSISRSLVEKMGGAITLDSEQGRGSDFTVTLILDEAETLDATDGISAPSTDGPPVLVVDDNPVNRKLLQIMLAKLGCTVEFASDGAQAVEMASAQRYAAIFMDVQMPVMSGIDATKEIRQKQKTKIIPIIAVTADGLSQDRDACFAAGMNEYLVKPLDQKMLADVLRKVGIGRE